MHDRCRKSSERNRKHYADRGIVVCERWKSFDAFFEDMGNPPDGLSLDRVDNDGNYCKENCRWADWKTQNTNNQRAAYIEFDGKKLRVREVEQSLGLSQGALWHRLQSGWSVSDACTTPRKQS